MSDKTFKIVNGDMSDGFHTFDELYEHRHALFIALCNTLKIKNCAVLPIKSRLHHDGSAMAGWFIAGMKLGKGMISYHLPNRLWDVLDADEVGCFPEWDGHTSQDVIERLMSYFGE